MPRPKNDYRIGTIGSHLYNSPSKDGFDKMTQIRPMLAAQKYRSAGDLWSPAHEQVVLQHLAADGFLIMQPKIDGMRCVLLDGIARSRSFKPLGNSALQTFAHELPQYNGLDGEVFSGHDYDPTSFRKSMSGVRASSGDRNLSIVLFDHIPSGHLSYMHRYGYLEGIVGKSGERSIEADPYHVKLMVCPQIRVKSLDEIYREEERLLADGWEGGIIRRWTKPYKFNRATALGGELVKVKRRDYVDAKVVGYEQRYENQNEAKTSELGYTTRSSHKEGKVPLEMVGALHLELLDGSNTKTKCGVFRGLGHDDLRALWQERETLPGRYCEVSVDKATGGYDSARTPVFIRWRDASEF